MKVLVTYFSLSGNTKKIAQAIHDAVMGAGYEVVQESLDNIAPGRFELFDLVFIGSACHDADVAEPIKEFMGGFDKSACPKLAGFVTHATSMPEGTRRNVELYEEWAGRCKETFLRISHEKSLIFLGFFHCQGAPVPPIADFIHREILPDKKEWETYLENVMQHPNEDDLEKARQFAQTILTACEKADID